MYIEKKCLFLSVQIYRQHEAIVPVMQILHSNWLNDISNEDIQIWYNLINLYIQFPRAYAIIILSNMLSNARREATMPPY